MPNEQQAYLVASSLEVKEGVVTRAARPLLAIDEGIQRVLDVANGLTLQEMLATSVLQAYSPILIRAAVGLLREAGILVCSVEGAQRSAGEGGTRSMPVSSSTALGSRPRTLVGSELVSVVILNRDGRSHLEACLSSLLSQTWGNTQIILVDNGSTDDSVSFVRQNYPTVRILELGENSGFSAGNNRGMEVADGDHVFFLNNDTEVSPFCIEEMMLVAGRHPDAAAIAPKLKFQHGRAFIQGIGNSVRGVNWGSDNYIGFLDLGQFDDAGDVFSACFGAALIDRRVWECVGPLDEAYFFYYEDSDWSYRARAMGFRIVSAPRAVVYHKFGGSMEMLPTPFKLGLVVCNRLRFALKNLQKSNAFRFTVGYLLEDVVNVVWALLRRREWRQATVYLRGWGRLAASLPDVLRARRQVQALRRVPDTEILPLADNLPPPQMRGSTPWLGLGNIDRYYLPAIRSGRARSVPELGGFL